MGGTASKEPLTPDTNEAGVTSSPEPAVTSAPVGPTAIDSGASSEQPASALGGDTSGFGNEGSSSPAPEIIHTVAEPPAVDHSEDHETAPGVVNKYDPMAATEASSAPVTETPAVSMDPGNGQVASEAPTTLEQPTADLSSVGVGLGDNKEPEVSVAPAGENQSPGGNPGNAYGGADQVSQNIRALHSEGTEVTTPVKSKWGMEKAPSVDATVAEGWGAKLRHMLHLSGSKSPVKVTTSTVPASEVPGVAQTPNEAPAPTSNPV